MRYSVTITPDSAACAEIDKWRARFDAHYKLIGPHLTVAFPGNLEMPAEIVKERVASVASAMHPFPVTLDRWVGATELYKSHPEETCFLIERYPNAANMLVLLVDRGASEALSIRRSLSTAIPQPPLLLGYPPYIAIGQSLTDCDYKAAKAELSGYQPTARFTAAAIELLAEQADGPWKLVSDVPLGWKRGYESH